VSGHNHDHNTPLPGGLKRKDSEMELLSQLRDDIIDDIDTPDKAGDLPRFTSTCAVLSVKPCDLGNPLEPSETIGGYLHFISRRCCQP